METEENSGQSEDQLTCDVTEQADNFLAAIKEVDEHSNYSIENDNSDVSDNETNQAKTNKPIVETKRKLFSRQSSAASLITKNTDSFGDSGIETMDSVNCSEIRDQPDIYDVDMADDEAKKDQNNSHGHARDTRAIYDGNEEDEDMIEAHLVHESLSRVSSNESLTKLNELDTEKPNERVLNFVNEYNTVYVEVIGDPSPEVLKANKETDERLDRATILQRAISKQSFTSPRMTVCKSNTSRPQTARPSVNGIHCSHIDIDLSCDAPPKADIKSYRNFSDRIKSAGSSSERSSAFSSARNMTVIDIADRINAEGSSSPSSERCRWPLRPLTRPRSPLTKRPSNKQDKQISLELKCVSAGKKPSNKRHSRAKSALPVGRCVSPVHLSSQTYPKRPQTASLPYTSSRLSNDRKRDVLVSEPFANSDELYPNKSMLTTFHHGFRSIWPIGRKINLIQNKRPFESFEMNSYSRSVERCQFPLKGDHSINIKPVSPSAPRDDLKPLTIHNNIVLSPVDQPPSPRKPAIRKLSLYITPNVTPRSVR